jgi:hypothetical protein
MFYTSKEASFFKIIMTWLFGRESFSIRIVEWKALQGEGYTPFQIAPRRRTFRKVLEIINQSSRRAGARPSRATRRVSPSHVSSWINECSLNQRDQPARFRSIGPPAAQNELIRDWQVFRNRTELWLSKPASKRLLTWRAPARWRFSACWKWKKEGPFSHYVRRSNQRFSSQSNRESLFLFLVTLLSMQWKNHPFLFACPVR